MAVLAAPAVHVAPPRCPVTVQTVTRAIGVPMHRSSAPPSGVVLCTFEPRRATSAYPAIRLYRFPDPNFGAKTLAQMRALYKAFPAAGITKLGGGAFMAATKDQQILVELYSAHVKAQAYFTSGYGMRRAVGAMRALYAAFR